MYSSEELSNNIDIIHQMYDIIINNLKITYIDFVENNNDFDIWFENSIKRENQKTILLFRNNELCGYLQYQEDKDMFFWCEMQIKHIYKGDKSTFKNIIKFFVENNNVKNETLIKAKINPKNKKSIGVFTNMGFNIGNNNEYSLIGKQLIDWYNKH